MKKLEPVLIICFCLLGVISSVDIVLSEFFELGTLQNNFLFLYLVIFVLENESNKSIDVLSKKVVKYPMYLSLTLFFLSSISVI
tara:strand:+ start:612 stop:863 length:252 start_codon:yes stop_codon:yes gene_type:complete